MLSLKRKRTSAVVDEFVTQLLARDILQGSVDIDDITGDGRLLLSKFANLSHDLLQRLVAQRDLLISLRNIKGNILVTFGKKPPKSAASAAPVPAAAEPKVKMEGIRAVVPPRDLEKYLEVTTFMAKCLPQIESATHRQGPRSDPGIVLVGIVPHVDSFEIRALMRHANIASVCVYPEKETSMLVVQATIRPF